MKYRILILTHAIPYYWERGASLRVHMIAAGLASLGNKVEIVTTHLGRDVDIDGVRIHRVPKVPFINNVDIGFSFVWILLGFLILLKAFMLLVKERRDLIVAESGTGALWGVFLKKLFGIPLVYDMHNSLGESLAVHNVNFPMKYADMFDKFLYRNADFIIANAEAVKEGVLKLYPTHKILTIFDRIVDDAIAPQNEFHFINDRYILYVGNFAEYQGVDLLIDAFSIVHNVLPETRLVLIGDNLPDQLRTKVSLNDSIYYLGRLTLPETNRVLKHATVAAFPALYSAVLGMKLIHYIQFGKAIVASNRPQYSSLLEDKKSVLLCKPYPRDMANKIMSILNSELLRKELEANTLLIAAKEFSMSALRYQLKVVLDYCLGQ